MGHRTGAVLMAPNGFPLRLNDSQYASLRNLFGNDDISTGVAIEGLPLRIERRASYVEIPLSNGGSMFGESEVGPYFVVPAFAGAFGRYQAEGGPTGRLGLPTSIPFVPVVTTPWHEVGRWILEFEFGYMALAGDGRIQVDFVEDPGLLWHSLPRPSGSIVAQPGGQSWYIDHNRRRHWIPDGATYECLGGRSNAPSELQNLPGYAVWSFELAPVATCALDPGE